MPAETVIGLSDLHAAADYAKLLEYFLYIFQYVMKRHSHTIHYDKLFRKRRSPAIGLINYKPSGEPTRPNGRSVGRECLT
jgi:hypothetical protein